MREFIVFPKRHEENFAKCVTLNFRLNCVMEKETSK
jgi:hypothetical protein